jgi:hypothetical protein
VCLLYNGLTMTLGDLHFVLHYLVGGRNSRENRKSSALYALFEIQYVGESSSSIRWASSFLPTTHKKVVAPVVSEVAYRTVGS